MTDHALNELPHSGLVTHSSAVEPVGSTNIQTAEAAILLQVHPVNGLRDLDEDDEAHRDAGDDSSDGEDETFIWRPRGSMTAVTSGIPSQKRGTKKPSSASIGNKSTTASGQAKTPANVNTGKDGSNAQHQSTSATPQRR
ncbi:hypothetical protein IEO21_00154 [Rhodonia placenta]|uniref:Uncharacterized protein n=1 Tax=Rhodonia placenta TaxID=104341 RepID=A0A8H7PC79_9APHY|nr:hypothetical protein IEO21_00154 [Postia placenta]